MDYCCARHSTVKCKVWLERHICLMVPVVHATRDTRHGNVPLNVTRSVSLAGWPFFLDKRYVFDCCFTGHTSQNTLPNTLCGHTGGHTPENYGTHKGSYPNLLRLKQQIAVTPLKLPITGPKVPVTGNKLLVTEPKLAVTRPILEAYLSPVPVTHPGAGRLSQTHTSETVKVIGFSYCCASQHAIRSDRPESAPETCKHWVLTI